MEPFRVRRMKVILLVSSLVFLLFLLLAAFEENFTAQWRIHQSAYAELLKQQASQSGKPAVKYALEIKQLYLEDLGRVDRCVTCHVGIDNPAFATAEAPLAAHPGDLLTHHPSDKFGCTICHQGQGRATVKDDAHGRIAHWPEPMLHGDLVYTSCGRCHYENDLYGGQSDLYGQVSPIQQISQGEIEVALPGAENIARGKRLVIENGCLGCHKYRGRGGKLGPDITYVGEKTVHDYDFKHVHGERTVENWLFTHFKSPAAVVPNTLMPELGLDDLQTHDLTAYMMSLKRKSAPAAYTPLPRPVDAAPVRGETLYAAYCSACHGVDGVGAIVRDPLAARLIDHPRELITPSLRNIDTLGVGSDAYMREIIASGRPGTSMPAWTSEGLTGDEIDLLVGFIRRWEPREADASMISASRGEPRYGRPLYRANCEACHGADGSGGQIGISLRSPTFLAIASDEFLTATILQGRANTAMPSWRQFDNRDMSDLLAYIRSWQPLRSKRDEVLTFARATMPAAATPASDPESSTEREDPGGEDIAVGANTGYVPSASIGHTLYRSRCEVCHGDNGQGEIGPSLHNDSVLRAVSNEFLHDTIVRGRPGTAMPAWRQLSSEDVADVIAFLRSWQTGPAKQLASMHVSGDWENGELLFRGMCSSCHGPHAEGAIGPQLINPVFLDTVSDATLVEWISQGRDGTQMRPFLRGKQGAASLSASQIEDIVTFLRSRRGQRPVDGQRIGLGFAPRGQVLFQRMCESCHGPQGEGATGPGIRNPAFLAAASDGFLRATIVLGRDGTEMRSLAHRGSGIAELRAEQIDDLIAFIRGNEDRTAIPHRFVMGAHAGRGTTLYASFCAGCHGENGKGLFAPELNNPGFLRAATDGYLQATVIRGRRGTAMRAFGLGSHGLANLTQDQINDIVAHVRQWSPDTRPLQRTEPFPSLAGGE